MLTRICRGRLSGRFAHNQKWGDRYAGITIFCYYNSKYRRPCIYLRRSHKIVIGVFKTKLLLCRGDFRISGNGFICIKVWGFALLILSIPFGLISTQLFPFHSVFKHGGGGRGGGSSSV